MISERQHKRVEDLKARAHGQWTSILKALGVSPDIVNRRNQPCPLCGGTDRFQYNDKYGEGNYWCRGCGPGGGFKLLEAVMGWDFVTVLDKVEECVGSSTWPAPATKESTPSVDQMQSLAQKIWRETQPIQAGDDVDRYLRGRGLGMPVYPAALRFHRALGYYERIGAHSKRVGEYPAMVASVQGSDGRLLSLHRTYLKNGFQACGRGSKKLLCAGIRGAAIRLFEANEVLAVAEGIETALAVHLATGKPVWPALNAGNLEQLWLPACVEQIHIYADNDADSEFDGQAAAYALAKRLCRESKAREGAARRRVEVFVPMRRGADWADVWLTRSRQERQAA